MRSGKVERKTRETDISVELELESGKEAQVETGIGFFDHMLTAFAKNAAIGLKVRASGDLKTGAHHTIEDVGICMGEAVAKALGEKRGINRYGFFILPMDDALSQSAVDFGGRNYCKVDAEFKSKVIGGFDIEAVPEFFAGFAQGARANVNVKCLEGKNDHHKIESMFKSFGRSVRMAISIDPVAREQIPSTKGVI